MGLPNQCGHLNRSPTSFQLSVAGDATNELSASGLGKMDFDLMDGQLSRGDFAVKPSVAMEHKNETTVPAVVNKPPKRGRWSAEQR